jgi:hypothetical protein
MASREKVVREVIRRIRQEWPDALGCQAVFYDPNSGHAGEGGLAYHIHHCTFDFIDEVLADPRYAHFAVAGAAVVIRRSSGESGKPVTDYAIAIARGPNSEMHRTMLRSIAERMTKSARELAIKDEAAARELAERLNREASKN